MRDVVRSYDRERLPYRADRKMVEQYAQWFTQVPWRFFCTFTFAWKVSDTQAIATFDEFINRLERDRRSDVAYLRGDEKRFSGCGKPACARHFHVLLASAAPLSPGSVQSLWMSMAGSRTDHAGAQVVPYKPDLPGVSYVLKSMNQPDGDWTFSNNLYLFLPSAIPETVTCRMRRRLRRHHMREQQFARITVAEVPKCSHFQKGF
jgi:hypothetical protein